jgi:hypothetical protein
MIQVHRALFIETFEKWLRRSRTIFTGYAKPFYYQWKKLEKGSTRNEKTFAEASKEVTYEESCLRDSYSHNGHLSHKPIVQ